MDPSHSAHRSQDPARAIRVVVTCTDRKTATPLGDLRLRNHPEDLAGRASSWLAAVGRAPAPYRSARDLYKGEHWSVINRFAGQTMPGGWSPDVWVASAGYGLVPLTAPLVAYSATFAAGHADSVSATGGRPSTEHNQTWWAMLADWEGPVSGQPRTIAALAAKDPEIPLLFVGSNNYLRATGPDLTAAREELVDPALLAVVSAGAKYQGLHDNLLPGDARLQNALKGSRLSLNARIAALLLANADRHEFELPRTAAFVETLLAEQPALTVYDRTPLSDDEVIAYIREQWTPSPGASRTELLRRLRASGRACEQKRFSALYSTALERTSL